jgi:hypothetical protein
MKKIFLMLPVTLYISFPYIANAAGGIDDDIVRETKYHLSVDPIATKTILSSVADCDDKFALMHLANVEIAQKSRDDFYYQNKIYPAGRYAFQKPNVFEKYVMDHPDQFASAGEGVYEITANDYWIKKIIAPDHPAIADYEYQKIKLFYDVAWEDGDGSMQSNTLIKKFTEWIKKHPKHAKVAEAEKLIAHMNNYRRGNNP